MNGKIYYNKDTKKVIGSFRPEKLDYKDIPSPDFIELHIDDWMSFLNKHQGKEFFVEEGSLTAKEIEVPIEKIKENLIETRRNTLRNTGFEWFDDVENIPSDVKEQRNILREEISIIKKASSKEELQKFINNN